MSIHKAKGERVGPEDLHSDEIFDHSNSLVLNAISVFYSSFDSSFDLEGWYRFVRDSIRYDPYAIELEAESLSASRTLKRHSGHCIHKSVLFVAGLRALGVPARLGLARVRNHLATEKLERRLGTDVLVPHGYAAHWNGQRWVKSTPVFNRELCERLGARPLAWSAEEDRVFQPTDANGSQFMEYLEDYGLFAEVPMDFLKARLQAEYPHCFTASGQWRLPPET